MEVKEALFVMSNTDVEKCPAPNKPEYAFIGRSNVGKSSLINMLTKKKGLAKISGRPGKTQLINHFLINKEWYLVDLPGYGYAKVPKAERMKWEKFIRKYILKRENLFCLFVLIDIRHSAQKVDLDFMQWLGISEVPFTIIFTKADKLKPTELEAQVKAYEEEMFKTWEMLPEYFISSSVNGVGKEEILEYIDEINQANATE